MRQSRRTSISSVPNTRPRLSGQAPCMLRVVRCDRRTSLTANVGCWHARPTLRHAGARMLIAAAAAGADDGCAVTSAVTTPQTAASTTDTPLRTVRHTAGVSPFAGGSFARVLRTQALRRKRSCRARLARHQLQPVPAVTAPVLRCTSRTRPQRSRQVHRPLGEGHGIRPERSASSGSAPPASTVLRVR